jgi:hypothetical protein
MCYNCNQKPDYLSINHYLGGRLPLPIPDGFPVVLGLLPPGLEGVNPTPPFPPLGAEFPPPFEHPLPFAIIVSLR